MKDIPEDRDEVAAFAGQLTKLTYKIGYEKGWNDCLDDIIMQLKQTGSHKKIVFQYYGKKELSEDQGS